MKLLIAIVQDDDASRLVENLMAEGLGATKLATTGGFLRSGNTTLLIGVQDESMQKALDIIEKICKSRKQIATSSTNMLGMPGSFIGYPMEVVIGGATVFIVNVEQFIKM